MSLYEYARGQPDQMDPLGLSSIRKTLQGPTALLVSWINSFTYADEIQAIVSVEAAYAANVGPVNWRILIKIALAVQELARSANPAPPLVFTPATFAAWDSSKEHRGWSRLDPRITCCDDRVERAVSGFTDDVGWTPLTMPVWPFWRSYSRAESGGGGVTTRGVWDPVAGKPGKCRIFTALSTGRISPVENVLQSIGLTGNLAPFISREIEYTICCDGYVKVDFRGSYFPSHRAYAGMGGNVTTVGARLQDVGMLGTFMWSTGIIPPTHITSYTGTATEVPTPGGG